MPSTHIIKLAGVGEVVIRKSTKAKRFILRINPAGKPVVTIPRYSPYYLGEHFARQHTAWLAKHQTPNAPPLLNNQLIGRDHHIRFQAMQQELIKSRVSKTEVVVSFPADLAPSDPAVQAEATKAATRAIKREAEAVLPARLFMLAKQHGYNYKSVSVKNMTSRWGSCSNNGVINLSIWLMQTSDELINYVICHELAHLKQPNHSPAFWQTVATMVPDYSRRRSSLKQHAPRLLQP